MNFYVAAIIRHSLMIPLCCRYYRHNSNEHISVLHSAATELEAISFFVRTKILPKKKKNAFMQDPHSRAYENY